MRRVLHVARRALHVHGDDARSGLPRDIEHRRVAQAGHVVDDRRACCHRCARDGGLHRVDRDDEPRIAREPRDDGQHAPQFLLLRHGARTGPGGFAADVDDLRALLREPPCL